jgi:hypothetical protein
MSRDVLIVSGMDGAENCAKLIASQIGGHVEVAADGGTALVTLRGREFDVVVVEERLAEADPAWADQVWALAGLAVPVQVNFAISGCARLGREVKAALVRKDGERAVARRAAFREIEDDLKGAVTGLLLETELALREPAIPPALEPKLRHLVELASVLRERLRGAPAAGAKVAGIRV